MLYPRSNTPNLGSPPGTLLHMINSRGEERWGLAVADAAAIRWSRLRRRGDLRALLDDVEGGSVSNAGVARESADAGAIGDLLVGHLGLRDSGPLRRVAWLCQSPFERLVVGSLRK